MRDALLSLEERRNELESRKKVSVAPLLSIPTIAEMGEIYRDKLAQLREELARPESVQQARELLCSFIAEVRLTPDGDELVILVKGTFAGVMAAAGIPSAAGDIGCGGLHPTIPPELYEDAA